MLTGDENIVDINFIVLWKIKDAGKYLFDIRDPEDTVKAASESAMREIIGQTADRRGARPRAGARSRPGRASCCSSCSNDYGAGIADRRRCSCRRSTRPQEVIDAFRDVQRAQADRERAQQRGRGLRQRRHPARPRRGRADHPGGRGLQAGGGRPRHRRGAALHFRATPSTARPRTSRRGASTSRRWRTILQGRRTRSSSTAGRQRRRALSAAAGLATATTGEACRATPPAPGAAADATAIEAPMKRLIRRRRRSPSSSSSSCCLELRSSPSTRPSRHSCCSSASRCASVEEPGLKRQDAVHRRRGRYSTTACSISTRPGGGHRSATRSGSWSTPSPATASPTRWSSARPSATSRRSAGRLEPIVVLGRCAACSATSRCSTVLSPRAPALMAEIRERGQPGDRAVRHRGHRRAHQARRPAGREQPGDLPAHADRARPRGQAVPAPRAPRSRQRIRARADRERTVIIAEAQKTSEITARPGRRPVGQDLRRRLRARSAASSPSTARCRPTRTRSADGYDQPGAVAG